MSFIYIASPYTHSDPNVEEQRYHSALDCLTFYTDAGRIAYSPIVHNHNMVRLLRNVYGKTNLGWDFWSKIDFAFLEQSLELWVLCIQGWEESSGVQQEIAHADQLGLRVRYIAPIPISEGRYHLIERKPPLGVDPWRRIS